MENVSSALVKAIEQTWRAIQRRHNDVPEVVVTLASGTSARGMKFGHFAADRWLRGEDAIHELFIGGEGLARGGVGTLGTLLHEAGHAAAAARGIDAAITAHRRAEITGAGGRTSNNNGKAAECSCGRKIRASLAVLEAGPIICGICGEEFEPEEAGE